MHRVPVVLCGPADFHHSAVTVRDAFDLDAGLFQGAALAWHYAAYLYWFLKLNCVNAGAPDMIDDVFARVAATGYDTSRLLPGGSAAASLCLGPAAGCAAARSCRPGKARRCLATRPPDRHAAPAGWCS